MQSVKDIKQQLRKGDYQLIADRTGVARELVRSIFYGRRSAETTNGLAVLAAAEALIDLRKRYFTEAIHA
jgi:hypothetical protein